MKYIYILIAFLLIVPSVSAQLPDPSFPDIATPTPIPEIDTGDNNTSSDSFIYEFVSDLPMSQWRNQLDTVEQALISRQDYQRPSFIQGIGDAFGFVFWVNNNREALLGSFSPLFYNILIFISWALSSASIYVAIVLASAMRRMIQNFFDASYKIISLFK